MGKKEAAALGGAIVLGLAARGCADTSGLSTCADGRCDGTLPERTDAGDGGSVVDAEAGTTPTKPGACLWSKRFGDAASQFGAGVTLDPSGNVWLASTFQGSIDFGGGALVGKLAPAGHSIGVAKLDPNGTHLSSEAIDGPGDYLSTGMVANGATEIFLTGLFTGALDLGVASSPAPADGKYDAFLLRLRTNGQHAYGSFYTGAGPQMTFALATDPSVGAVVGGAFEGSLTGGGLTLTSTGHVPFLLHDLSTQNWGALASTSGSGEVRGVAYDRDAAVLAIGFYSGSLAFPSVTLDSAGGQDIFVAKYSGTGALLSAVSFGNATDESGWAIAGAPNGEVVVAGEFTGDLTIGKDVLKSAGGSDVFVARLDANLVPIAAYRFGGVANDRCQSLRVAPNGDIVFAGHTFGGMDLADGAHPSAGGADAFVIKLDATGAFVWSHFLSGPNDQLLYFGNLAVAPDGGVVAAGHLFDTADWGCGPMTSAGQEDVYVVRFAP